MTAINAARTLLMARLIVFLQEIGADIAPHGVNVAGAILRNRGPAKPGSHAAPPGEISFPAGQRAEALKPRLPAAFPLESCGKTRGVKGRVLLSGGRGIAQIAIDGGSVPVEPFGELG